MSVNATVETDYYAASAVRAVMKYLPIAYKDGDNLKAREEMGMAAHYGGIALNKAALGYVHAIAHQLGAYHGTPHGRANAIVLPYVLDINRKVSEKRLAALAKKVGIIDNSKINASTSDSELADQLITQVKALLKTLNINPTVTGMQERDFDSMAKAAAKEVSDTYAVPTYMNDAGIKEILMKIKKASDKANNDKSVSKQVA